MFAFPGFEAERSPRGPGNGVRKNRLRNRREDQSAHDHHRKKTFWGTLLASKKNFPGQWWIQNPYENQENHIYIYIYIYIYIFPLWPPLISANRSSALEQGGVCFFSQNRGRFDDETDNKRDFRGTPLVAFWKLAVGPCRHCLGDSPRTQIPMRRPGTSLWILNSHPEVPQKFHRLGPS